MTQLEDISVIICAYTEERWDDLVTAVESARQQTLPAREIIVVIDRNPDLLSRVREYLPVVVAIENSEAKGASGARNSGAYAARGTILAFLDDDALAQPEWIANLAACYTSPSIVGVGGKIDPLLSEACPSWFPSEFYWTVGCSYEGMPTEDAPVRNVIGANMSMRKDVLIAVGGFRESFGNNKGTDAFRTGSKWLHHRAGDEETEFCMRVTQQLPDSVWLYTTSAIVQHHVPVSRMRWSYFLWRCYDEGLGKARLVKLHDTSTGLSSERDYTFKTLPRGIARGLKDSLLHTNMKGALRAAAISCGLAATTSGYVVGTISQRLAPLQEANSTFKQNLRHSSLQITK